MCSVLYFPNAINRMPRLDAGVLHGVSIPWLGRKLVCSRKVRTLVLMMDFSRSFTMFPGASKHIDRFDGDTIEQK